MEITSSIRLVSLPPLAFSESQSSSASSTLLSLALIAAGRFLDLASYFGLLCFLGSSLLFHFLSLHPFLHIKTTLMHLRLLVLVCLLGFTPFPRSRKWRDGLASRCRREDLLSLSIDCTYEKHEVRARQRISRETVGRSIMDNR